MVLVHGNIIPTKHVGERTDSLRSKNWILILKKIDLTSIARAPRGLPRSVLPLQLHLE